MPHPLKPQSKHGTVLAVSMMKDEAPFLLEWVAHHLAVGFTDLLVYTNDCSDGTDDMLIRLEELGLAYHRRNDIPEGMKPQPSALNYAQAEPLVAGADWVLVFDADEFLAISHPSGQLEGLLDDATARGANGIVITWRIFGSAGVTDWSRAPVTEQYTRAAPPMWNKGWGVKTLFQHDPKYWKLGIHRPSIKNKWLETDFPDSVRWLNGSGLPMEDYFKFRGWRSIRRTVGYGWAQMNHYAVKSIDSYAVRKFRGNVNNKKDKYNAEYWSLQDRNEVEDRVILRHAADRARIMAALLEDPVLNRLHTTALARIEARLAEYKETDAYADLRAGLIEASKVPISQVEAKPPKARDPEKIAALMSAVEEKAAARSKAPKPENAVPAWAVETGDPYLAEPEPLDPQVARDWVENHGIPLPADPAIFPPETLSAVVAGRFERRHARNIAGYVHGMTRGLDLGAGLGFLALRAVQTVPGLSMLVQDSRTPLIALGQEIAERLTLPPGRLSWRTDPLTEASLAALMSELKPDLLRLSRPDDVTPNALAACDLAPVKRVLLPFVSDTQAETFRTRFAPVLGDAGLREIPERASAGTLQFDRSED